MNNIQINEYIKETLKIKGTIDVKKSTVEMLKKLEKKGVQVNLLLAGILDDLDYDEMLKSLENDNGNKKDFSGVNPHE